MALEAKFNKFKKSYKSFVNEMYDPTNQEMTKDNQCKLDIANNFKSEL